MCLVVLELCFLVFRMFGLNVGKSLGDLINIFFIFAYYLRCFVVSDLHKGVCYFMK